MYWNWRWDRLTVVVLAGFPCTPHRQSPLSWTNGVTKCEDLPTRKDETYNGSRGKSLGSISSLCCLGGGTFLSVGDRMPIPKPG
jgi:hypothetical protein